MVPSGFRRFENFQECNIDWPQQPATERISDISEKLNF